ncbi:MAG: hypothetical protein AAFO29_20340 [Actinomycetota bacterium]
MSFLFRTLIRAIYAALLGLAMLGWLGAAAGASERPSQPAPVRGIEPVDDPTVVVGIEPFDNPIFW